MAITLTGGFKMPIIGLGVWRKEGKGIRDLIHNALKIGHRHFDCAADYKNEAEVGEALSGSFSNWACKEGGPFHYHRGVSTTASALDEDGMLDIDTTISLETTWHAMEDLVSMGLVRSIGIKQLKIS